MGVIFLQTTDDLATGTSAELAAAWRCRNGNGVPAKRPIAALCGAGRRFHALLPSKSLLADALQSGQPSANVDWIWQLSRLGFGGEPSLASHGKYSLGALPVRSLRDSKFVLLGLSCRPSFLPPWRHARRVRNLRFLVGPTRQGSAASTWCHGVRSRCFSRHLLLSSARLARPSGGLRDDRRQPHVLDC